jgi:hypothetical protein
MRAMPDHKPPPQHPLPPQPVWDRFCDEVAVASQMLARLVPAQPPLERLSPAQYACGKCFAAMDELLRALGAPREIRELVALPARAWQRAAWGIADPLLRAATVGSGRPSANEQLVVFRAMVLKLADEELVEGRAKSWRSAAQTVSSALQQARAPKGYIPSDHSIRSWHVDARNPKTPADHHLAEAVAFFRHRPWPETAGETVEERIKWIVAGFRATSP